MLPAEDSVGCQKITNSERKYRSLFSHLAEGFAYCKIVLDSAGKPVDFIYLEVNDAFEQLTGLKKQLVLKKKVTEAVPNVREMNPEIFEIYGRVATTGKSERFELYFKPLSIWLHISAYSPKKGYFAAVFENITERKELEQKLLEYSKGLEYTVEERTDRLSELQELLLKHERLAAIGQLAAMVGHDLRNPLSGIKNASYYLRKKQPNLTDSSINMLNTIDVAVEHSNSIINDLLDFSRELHLELEEVSPKSLTDYSLLSIKIPSNVKLRDRTQNTPMIWVDTNKIERVFTNLIKNAIDAMSHGGILNIATTEIDGKIEFTFSDTGIGMSTEVMSKIFTPLFTTKAQGMGFGLAICKRIVEIHNGKISVTSVPGEGSTFTVTLPIEQKINEH
jgi:PAS domain S-box-containing protein